MTDQTSHDLHGKRAPVARFLRSRSIRLKAVAEKTRNAWAMVGISVALVVLLEGTCRVALWFKDRLDRPQRESREFADAYQGADWTKDYFHEFAESGSCEWHPYVYWRRQPYHGQWINIDDRGLRKTWAAAGEQTARPLRIFFFGGSTMWGSGARDDYTIASCVVRHLADRGVQAEVTNFGETAYVSKQELIALMGELEQGNVPDLVVFYDGVNDTFSAYQNRVAGLPQNEFNRRREFNTHNRSKRTTCGELVRYLFPGVLRASAAIIRRGVGRSALANWPRKVYNNEMRQSDDDLLADGVLEHYRSTIETVKVLAEAHQFHVLFYWQPTVFQKQRRSPDELCYRRPCDTFFKRVYQRIGSAPILAEDPDFHNLADIFAKQAEPLFIDCFHLAERGNDLIARRMVADIRLQVANTAREKKRTSLAIVPAGTTKIK